MGVKNPQEIDLDLNRRLAILKVVDESILGATQAQIFDQLWERREEFSSLKVVYECLMQMEADGWVTKHNEPNKPMLWIVGINGTQVLQRRPARKRKAPPG